LSATGTFAVIVLDTRPDFSLSIGSTAVLTGAGASVPLRLQSGVDLTSLHLVFAVSSDRLTNFNLSGLAPEVGSANFIALGSNRFEIRFDSRTDALLQGNLTLAQFGFLTVSNEHSAVSTLRGESLTGQRAVSPLSVTGQAGLGRVFVVGQEPILDAAFGTNRQLALTLYALPGEQYALERDSALGDANLWTFDSFVSATDLRTDLPLRPMSNPAEFFRVSRAPAGALGIRLEAGQVVIEWSLDCTGCVLEESGLVGPGSVWTPSTAQPQSVSGRYRVQLAQSGSTRFFRLAVPGP
jgi:hypothetical protein